MSQMYLENTCQLLLEYMVLSGGVSLAESLHNVPSNSQAVLAGPEVVYAGAAWCFRQMTPH